MPKKPKRKKVKMPWWGIVLIAIGACVIGALAAFCGTMLYIGKGMWQ